MRNFSDSHRYNKPDRFNRRDSGRDQDRGDRQMYPAVCSDCGQECEVPFRPTGDKPVYCSNCFKKMGGKNDDRSFDKPRFSHRPSFGRTEFNDRKPNPGLNNSQLEAIDQKLGKIIHLLESLTPKPSVPEPDFPPQTAEVKKKKPQKTKKTSPKK